MGRHFKDIHGRRFSRLTALYYAGIHSNPKRGAVWFCRCDCGRFRRVRRDYLESGHTRSCGCLRRENMANVGRDKARKAW